MKVSSHILNCFVATFFIVSPSFADDAALEELFTQLQTEDLPQWEQVEQKIWRQWSQSGSDAMDVLLDRGREALEAGDLVLAIDHFTALIDHAPDFAEGWNMRATAHFQDEEFGLSIADIQRTLALNPRHFGALQGLGRILEELREEESALEAYRAAFAIHPHRPSLKESIERLEAQVSGQNL